MNTIVRQINFDMDGTLCDFYGVYILLDDLELNVLAYSELI